MALAPRTVQNTSACVPHSRPLAAGADDSLAAGFDDACADEQLLRAELAGILKAPRSRVSEWLSIYQTDGVEGLLEGYESGRPPLLTEDQRNHLGDILDSGPVAYGLDTGLWTSPMLAWVIEEEFDVAYHPGHVRKLLHNLGFSVQWPRRVLARAGASQQVRWHRRTYPSLKKPAPKAGR